MYLYDVSFKAEKIIRKCLKVIEGLNLPISNSIRFIEIKGSDNYGSCVYNGTKSFSPFTALSHSSLKYSKPFAVDSIMIIVLSKLGTACNNPVIVVFLSPGQKANSDICKLLNV